MHIRIVYKFKIIMIMKLPKHALSLLLAIPLIISTACGDDDFSGGGGGKKENGQK